jgi:hypothetical protein
MGENNNSCSPLSPINLKIYNCLESREKVTYHSDLPFPLLKNLKEPVMFAFFKSFKRKNYFVIIGSLFIFYSHLLQRLKSETVYIKGQRQAILLSEVRFKIYTL